MTKAIEAVLVLVVLSTPLQAIDPTEELPLKLGVRVYNLAKVPVPTLALAEEKASEVFRSMGIVTDWANCPLEPEELATHEACNTRGPDMLTIKVVPESVAKMYYGSKNSLGFALLSDRGRLTGDAWVFFDRVAEQADVGDCFLPTALGYAIVHEIGHLLLGEHGHASSGIMKGSWSRGELRKAETGRLGFSDRECRKMRAQVMERLKLRVGTLWDK